MAIDITKLTAASERITNAKDAVLAFISGVPNLIREAVAADDLVDATNVNALADRLESDAQVITDAIVAGTPAEEPPASSTDPGGGVVTGDGG